MSFEEAKNKAARTLEDYSEPDVLFNGSRYIHESKVLSKQRVREAIKEVKDFYDGEEYNGSIHWASILIKRLGL